MPASLFHSIQKAKSYNYPAEDILNEITKQDPKMGDSIKLARLNYPPSQVLQEIERQNDPLQQFTPQEKRDVRGFESYKPPRFIPYRPYQVGESALETITGVAVNFPASAYNFAFRTIPALIAGVVPRYEFNERGIAQSIKAGPLITELENAFKGGVHKMLREYVPGLRKLPRQAEEEVAERFYDLLQFRYGINFPVEAAKFVLGKGSKQDLNIAYDDMLENLTRTVKDDPAGFGLEFFNAIHGTAHLIGYGKGFDVGVSKLAQAVEKPVLATSRAIAKTGRQITGYLTGTGERTVAKAIESTREKPLDVFQQKSEFIQARKGRISEQDIVEKARDLGENIRIKQRADYLSKLEKIKLLERKLPKTQLQNKLSDLLKEFGVNEKLLARGQTRGAFAGSKIGQPRAYGDIIKVYDSVTHWKDWTPKGVDALKQKLGDFYSESSNARALVQGMYRETRNLLVEKVPGYEQMIKPYAETSAFIKEMERALSLGDRASYDTAFRKLTSAMKPGNELRTALFEALQQQGGGELESAIAGQQMQPFISRGYAGRAVGVAVPTAISWVKGINAVLDPKTLALFAVTSPRVMSSFLRGLGAVEGVADIVVTAVNNSKLWQIAPMLATAGQPIVLGQPKERENWSAIVPDGARRQAFEEVLFNGFTDPIQILNILNHDQRGNYINGYNLKEIQGYYKRIYLKQSYFDDVELLTGLKFKRKDIMAFSEALQHRGFVGKSLKDVIWVDENLDIENYEAVIAHELTHQILEQNFPGRLTSEQQETIAELIELAYYKRIMDVIRRQRK